jgi:hypothetical protein
VLRPVLAVQQRMLGSGGLPLSAGRQLPMLHSLCAAHIRGTPVLMPALQTITTP